MADYSDFLRDENNNVVYPKTLISNVIFEDGSTIAVELAKKVNTTDVSLTNGVLKIKDVEVDLNSFGSIKNVKLNLPNAENFTVTNNTVVIPVDTTATENSNNLITSGAVAKELKKSDNIKILTQEEYETLQTAGTVDTNTFYIISDNVSGDALPYVQSFDATNIVSLSKAQYDALITANTVDNNTVYVVTDSEDVTVANTLTKRIEDLEALVQVLRKDNVALATRLTQAEAAHSSYMTASAIEALIDYKINQSKNS